MLFRSTRATSTTRSPGARFNTQGVKVMNLAPGDLVVDVARVVKEDEADDGDADDADAPRAPAKAKKAPAKAKAKPTKQKK